MVDSPCSSRSLATFTSLPLPAAAPGASAECAEPARLALARLRSAPLDSPSSRYGPPRCPRRQAASVWHNIIAANSDTALPSLSLLTVLEPDLPAMLECLLVMAPSSQTTRLLGCTAMTRAVACRKDQAAEEGVQCLHEVWGLSVVHVPVQ